MNNPSQPQGVEVFTGGLLATNAYLIRSANPERWIAFDAPDGLAADLKARARKLAALVLTHGHFDHVWDAAAIAREHGCPVYAHPADEAIIRDPAAMPLFGLEDQIPGVESLSFLAVPDRGAATAEIAGVPFQLFHIPGHSPGSVTFYRPSEGILIGGDVLFAGGIGRTDLPGGSTADLLSGIRAHLKPLPQDTVVLPGHGGPTTIGAEMRRNPYLQFE